VQFSQLPCSDFSRIFVSGGAKAGPQRSPLGFSADSGGLPLYKGGVLVGGIGVISKATYSLDPNVFDFDVDDDEVIAIAGAVGHDAPAAIQAQNITVDGLSLRYTDATTADLAVPVFAPGAFTPIAVAGFADATVIAGQSFGTAASGIRADNGATYPGVNAFVFDTGSGTMRFAPRAGLAPAGGLALTAAEAQRLVVTGLQVAFSTRGQIRIPTNSIAQVTVSVVDLDGNILATARTPDAPVFGADVSIQKARSAVFFSRTDAAASISALTTSPRFADYIERARALIGATAFSDGIAYSERAIGNLARPFYPDGIDGTAPGPLSLPFNDWSIFDDGLQLDLVAPDIAAGGPPPALGCTNRAGLQAASGGTTRLANGLQIFPGGEPVYRGDTLVGAVGVSGDGIDQDDLISFLAIQYAGGSLNNAPQPIRADTLTPGGARLRYVNCPFAPFLNSSIQNPCG
jgi:uncharacterized protein GlcG (DUF336 family)